MMLDKKMKVDTDLCNRKLLNRFREEQNLMKATSTAAKKVDGDDTVERAQKLTKIWMLSAFYRTLSSLKLL